MFSPQRLGRFLKQVLLKLGPIIVLVFVLGLATELIIRDAGWPELRTSGEFWLAVVRDMVPGIVALIGVLVLATRFIQGLHGLQDFGEARGVVIRCLFGLRSFGPWVRIAGGSIDGERDHILRRVGGPGHLVVYNDSAVLLERAGRFTKIESKEFPRLEPFEKIYQVVDLRPKRWVYDVSAISKEGIPIVCEADILYQIENEDKEPTEEVPFPAAKDKIFQAAACMWIREADRPEETRTMDWGGRVIISETEGNLRTILARYPLDRLIGLLSPDDKNFREEIRQELEKKLREGVPKLGAQILGVELGDIRVEDEVTQQWIEAWQARWASWASERQALGRAKQIEQLEEAKTAAQVMMIKSITGAFRPMAAENRAASSRLILARLFMVLGRAATEPWTRVYLPQEAMNTLKVFQEMSK